MIQQKTNNFAAKIENISIKMCVKEKLENGMWRNLTSSQYKQKIKLDIFFGTE